jgi:hypothetical protein|uniref:PH domain-containing protein n=1 Tax=Desulfobacca acetoxidans TaxID=60893 RepID=A0A7C3UZE0_9BACT
MAAANASQEKVWRPASRAFFVYYVAIAVAVLGPLINPAVGFPPWLGLVLGLLILAAVGLRRFGQEYRATPAGLKRLNFWPPGQEDLSWPEVGEITVQRGLTQTLLNTGNVVIHDKRGAPRLYWEKLANPQAVKAELEVRLVEFSRSAARG